MAWIQSPRQVIRGAVCGSHAVRTPLPSGDSAVVDDFILDVRKGEGTTSLRLLGSGVPESAAWDKTYVRMRMGWERLMARMKVTLESPPVPKKPEPAPPPKDPPLPGLDY